MNSIVQQIKNKVKNFSTSEFLLCLGISIVLSKCISLTENMQSTSILFKLIVVGLTSAGIGLIIVKKDITINHVKRSVWKILGFVVMLIFMKYYNINNTFIENIFNMGCLKNIIESTVYLSIFIVMYKAIQNLIELHGVNAYYGFFWGMGAMALELILLNNVAYAIIFFVGVYDLYLRFATKKIIPE